MCVTGPCAVDFSRQRRRDVVDVIKSPGGGLSINKEGAAVSCFRSKVDALWVAAVAGVLGHATWGHGRGGGG